jgi:uncharacterized surface protein with fasciclin (FAS1) repeats
MAAPVLAADKDIVDTAASAGQFATLTRALQAGGLVDTLKGPGPFTLFAPTDEAFDRLPPGTLDDLLRPENRQRLFHVLSYHIVPGRSMAADLTKLNGRSVNTLQGMTAPVRVDGQAVMIGTAHVAQTDIEATNGVIHAIDFVLMPPSPVRATTGLRTTAAPVYLQDPRFTPTAYLLPVPETPGATAPTFATPPATTTFAPGTPMVMQPYGARTVVPPRYYYTPTRYVRTQGPVGRLLNRLGIGGRNVQYYYYR